MVLKQYIKFRIIKLIFMFLLLSALVSCNGGNGLSPKSTNQQISLREYINSLTKTATTVTKQLGEPTTYQQSFTSSVTLIIRSIQINIYNGATCSGDSIFVNTLNGNLANPVVVTPGTYTSTNKSNNVLCSNYVNESFSGCGGLYDNMSNGVARSMQFTYNVEDESGNLQSIVAPCMYNESAQVGSILGVEGVANWKNAESSTQCVGNGVSSCGFSRYYNVVLTTNKLMFISLDKWDGNLVDNASLRGWNPSGLSPSELAESGIYAANYLCQQVAHSFGYDSNGESFVAVINGGSRLNNFLGYYVNLAESEIFSGSDASRINPLIYDMPNLINAVLIQGQNAESDISANVNHWYWTAASPDGSFLTESGYTGSMDKPGDEMGNFNGTINASCNGFTDGGNWPIFGIVGRQFESRGLMWWNYNNNRPGSKNTDPVGTSNVFSAVVYAKTIGTENALWCAQR